MLITVFTLNLPRFCPSAQLSLKLKKQMTPTFSSRKQPVVLHEVCLTHPALAPVSLPWKQGPEGKSKRRKKKKKSTRKP